MDDPFESRMTDSGSAGAATSQARVRQRLWGVSNAAFGIGLIGIPWACLQPDGYGPTLSFVGLVVGLLLRYAAPRL